MNEAEIDELVVATIREICDPGGAYYPDPPAIYKHLHGQHPELKPNDVLASCKRLEEADRIGRVQHYWVKR